MLPAVDAARTVPTAPPTLPHHEPIGHELSAPIRRHLDALPVPPGIHRPSGAPANGWFPAPTVFLRARRVSAKRSVDHHTGSRDRRSTFADRGGLPALSGRAQQGSVREAPPRDRDRPDTGGSTAPSANRVFSHHRHRRSQRRKLAENLNWRPPGIRPPSITSRPGGLPQPRQRIAPIVVPESAAPTRRLPRRDAPMARRTQRPKILRIVPSAFRKRLHMVHLDGRDCTPLRQAEDAKRAPIKHRLTHTPERRNR